MLRNKTASLCSAEEEQVKALGDQITVRTEGEQRNGDPGLGLNGFSLIATIDALSLTNSAKKFTSLLSVDGDGGAIYQAVAQEVDPRVVVLPESTKTF